MTFFPLDSREERIAISYLKKNIKIKSLSKPEEEVKFKVNLLISS